MFQALEAQANHPNPKVFSILEFTKGDFKTTKTFKTPTVFKFFFPTLKQLLCNMFLSTSILKTQENTGNKAIFTEPGCCTRSRQCRQPLGYRPRPETETCALDAASNARSRARGAVGWLFLEAMEKRIAKKAP